MIVRNNLPVLNTLTQLNRKQTKMSKTMRNLSSGLRINSAADDAAGLSISEKMRAQIRGLAQASRNAQDGISLVQTAEGGLSEVHAMLHRMRELAVQAASDTLTDQDRGLAHQEIVQLKQAIDGVAYNTEFNTIPLLRNENKLTITTETVSVTSRIAKGFVEVENYELEVPDLSGLTSEQKNAIKADVVFVIDHSGSMGTSIENVSKNIENFLEHFDGTDVKIGLVTYSDDRFVSYDLGMTVNEFRGALANLEVSGALEYALEAIQDYALPLSFRADASKHMVLVTDEPGDVRSGQAHTANDVRQALDDEGITMHVVTNSSMQGSYNEIRMGAVAGNGLELDLNSQVFREELYSLLTEIVKETGALPVPIPTKTIFETVEQLEYEDVTWDQLISHEEEFPFLLHIGANQDQNMHLRLCDVRTHAIGVAGVSIQTRESANRAISQIDQALERVSEYRSRFGAYQNRLEHAIKNLDNSEENLVSARSRIADADMAFEMMEKIKTSILMEAGQAMLAHGKQLPEQVLSLLQR